MSFKEDKSYPELPEWVKPGVSFHVFFQEGNPNNRKCHVRAVVDNRAVIRTWSKHKQRWFYEVEGTWFFKYDYIIPRKK